MAPESIEERQARLRALRMAAELSAAPDTTQDSSGGEQLANGEGTVEGQVNGEGAADGKAEAEPEPAIRFRNYVPRDETLKELKVAPPEVPKFDDPATGVSVDANGSEDPIISIAPKKANWDLRRDVAKKLEKLERRTQRAIIELMQAEEKRRQESGEAEVEVEDQTD